MRQETFFIVHEIAGKLYQNQRSFMSRQNSAEDKKIGGLFAPQFSDLRS